MRAGGGHALGALPRAALTRATRRAAAKRGRDGGYGVRAGTLGPGAPPRAASVSATRRAVAIRGCCGRHKIKESSARRLYAAATADTDEEIK